ncbi:hypothetical protein MHSWG343_07250 [Candidatus Mycoplasma haematohominis]|uniref:Uncharacterized protein n=1 Tax=Candidatus Mycoplasma haematohominis TaxID=1494318 RepID=A0A478FUF1_9MOLU|nr:hypothetical protein MHSWG343_07250 [Candidatus Mycoplasma haemohominis]
MSTQAIGAAAAGAAVIGGGGTLAAYAAGAFDAKWEGATFEEYAKSLGNLKYIGETGDSILVTPPDKTKITTRMQDSGKGTEYKNSIKSNWNYMKKDDVNSEQDKAKRPEDQDLFPSGTWSKENEIADWISVWCGAIRNKKVKVKRTKDNKVEWRTEFFETNNSWKAFEAVCLEAKDPISAG